MADELPAADPGQGAIRRTDGRYRERVARHAYEQLPASVKFDIELDRRVRAVEEFIQGLRGDQGIMVNGNVIVGPKIAPYEPPPATTPDESLIYTMGDSALGSDDPEQWTAPLALSLAQTDTWIRGSEPVNSAGERTRGVRWTEGPRYALRSTEGVWTFTDASATPRGWFNSLYDAFVRTFVSDEFGIYSISAETAGQQLCDATFSGT